MKEPQSVLVNIFYSIYLHYKHCYRLYIIDKNNIKYDGVYVGFEDKSEVCKSIGCEFMIEDKNHPDVNTIEDLQNIPERYIDMSEITSWKLRDGGYDVVVNFRDKEIYIYNTYLE